MALLASRDLAQSARPATHLGHHVALPQDVVRQVAEMHDDSLRQLILDPSGQLHPSILLFVGDEQIAWETPFSLKNCDVITILSPVSAEFPHGFGISFWLLSDTRLIAKTDFSQSEKRSS